MPQYTAKMADGRKIPVNIPFKMSICTESELFLRAAWFWQKEPETLAWINSFPNNCVFWDVGANVGCYSLFCAAQKAASMVYAFEPLLSNYKALVSNIAQNGWDDRVFARAMALSDERGMATFSANNLEAGSSGGQIGNVSEFIPQIGQPVEVWTGDALCAEYGPPDYIKIDVDGQELRILHGMHEVLGRKELKSILIEINADGDEITRILSEHGFALDARLNALRARKTDLNAIWRR